jgi:hemerythrin-like domain-containing protein
LIYFLKTFADKCHHGKEENYLFKELAVNLRNIVEGTNITTFKTS